MTDSTDSKHFVLTVNAKVGSSFGSKSTTTYLAGVFSTFDKAVDAMITDGQASLCDLAKSHNTSEKAFLVDNFLDHEAGIASLEIYKNVDGRRVTFVYYDINPVVVDEHVDTDNQTVISHTG